LVWLGVLAQGLQDSTNIIRILFQLGDQACLWLWEKYYFRSGITPFLLRQCLCLL